MNRHANINLSIFVNLKYQTDIINNSNEDQNNHDIEKSNEAWFFKNCIIWYASVFLKRLIPWMSLVVRLAVSSEKVSWGVKSFAFFSINLCTCNHYCITIQKTSTIEGRVLLKQAHVLSKNSSSQDFVWLGCSNVTISGSVVYRQHSDRW